MGRQAHLSVVVDRYCHRANLVKTVYLKLKKNVCIIKTLNIQYIFTY